MQIKIDTHSHTLVSGHAFSTIAEMANEAKNKGLDLLAITDHAPAMPGSTGMFYFQMLPMIERDFPKHYGLPILFGSEVNILNGNGDLDIPDSICRDLDLVIASIHPPCYDGTYSKEEITGAYIQVMNKGFVHIIGHPDDSRCLPDLEVLVKTAKKTRTLLEVNDSSMRIGSYREGARDNILRLLQLCKQYEVSIVTGSDAHIDGHVGNFKKTQEILALAQFPEELVATTDVKRLSEYVDLSRYSFEP